MVIVGVLFMHKKEAIAHLFSMRREKIMKGVLHFKKWWRVPPFDKFFLPKYSLDKPLAKRSNLIIVSKDW